MSVMDDELEKQQQIKETLVHSKRTGMTHPKADSIIKKLEDHVEEIKEAQESQNRKVKGSNERRPYNQNSFEPNVTTTDNKKPDRDSGGRQYGG